MNFGISAHPMFLHVNDFKSDIKIIKTASANGFLGILVNIYNCDDVIQCVTSLRIMTSLPILLWGVMSKHDALRSLDCAIDGIVVANYINHNDFLTGVSLDIYRTFKRISKRHHLLSHIKF
jgi:FMN-dependent dehydrogenase.